MTSIQELQYADVLARMRTDSFLEDFEKTLYKEKDDDKPAPATKTYEPIEFPRDMTKGAAKPKGAKKRSSVSGEREEVARGIRRPTPPPRERAKKPRFLPSLPPPPPFPAPVYIEDITFFNKATTRDGVNLLANNAPFRGRDGMEIVLDGVEYRTEEHATQAAKFRVASRVSDTKGRSFFLSDLSDMFRGTRFITYREAVEAGKRRTRLDSAEYAEWNDRRVEIQKRICMYKLSQYVEVRNALRYTKGTTLVFSSPYMGESAFWGMQKTETGKLVGKNMLGRIWMQLRDDPI